MSRKICHSAGDYRSRKRILSQANIACQEAALHGLGHWASAYPSAVAAIIDQYLDADAGRRADLSAYARSARCGCVQ
ncbi:hypothetical protein TomTYG45_38000 [Sphingobium sp. TomTYG45]